MHADDGGDPLSAYLGSLRRTAGFQADEALPAHEYRFRGIGARSAGLADHHRERGDEILRVIDRLGEPPAWAIAAELTWSRGWASLRGLMRRIALAETVAHLHHLAAAGLVAQGRDRPARWRATVDLTPRRSPPPPAR